MNINITKTGNNVVANINGVNNTVAFDASLYTDLIVLETSLERCETREAAEEIIAKAEKLIKSYTDTTWTEDTQFKVVIEDLLVKCQKSNKYYLIAKGERVDLAFPEVLAVKIKDLIDSESDFMPIIKAWTRFLRNPNLTEEKADFFGKYITSTYLDKEQYEKFINEDYTEEKAVEMSTYPGVSITKEGFLCCYKYVKLDTKKYDTETGELIYRYKHSFDESTGELVLDPSLCAEDLYFLPSMMLDSGDAFTADGELGHRVKIGAVHELDSWSMVNCDDFQSCVKGLHLGGRAYVSNFGGKSEWLMECFVDPSQIGAFTIGGDGAIRCKSYYVHNIKSTPVRGFYHSSAYAKVADAKWAIERADAINEANALIEIINKKKRVLSAI